MIITLVVTLIFALLQIVFVYKKRMNRGIRNTSIATLVSGIIVLLLGMMVNVIESFVVSAIGKPSDNIEQRIVSFITDNIAAVGSRIILIGAIYLGISIVLMILAIVVKKKILGEQNSNIECKSNILDTAE